MASSIEPQAPSAPPSRAVGSAIAFLIVACALDAVFAFQMHRSAAGKVAPLLVAALLLASSRLRAERRLEIVLVLVPVFFVLHGFQLYLVLGRPPPASAAQRAGRPFDSRGAAEVIRELDAQGHPAFPAVMPKVLLTRGFFGRGRDGLLIDGVSTLPLGGIGAASTVYCNEGGTWSIYDADERGFNNPRGLWAGAPVEIVVVGDSYAHGACVPPNEAFPARIRERFPATLNLGMGGNGPLLELATIREYAAKLSPKVVLWAYFRNDLGDLAVERKSPVLMRYVDDTAFRQGLFDKQEKIDDALRALSGDLIRTAPRWPGRLASLGLTRASAPLWLQDLIMGERNGAAAAVIRLDALGGTSAAEPESGPPDFDLFARVLGQAKAEVAGWGGKLAFVYVPDTLGMRSLATDPARARVLSIVKGLDVPLVDVQPVFDGQPIEPLRYHAQSHCSPAGYRVIADTVSEALPSIAPALHRGADPR